MSGYIMDLRKVVGHRTLIQCAASVIIINEAGELLLGKRTDNGLWGYAGGSVEIDERIEDCARRELYEETGIAAGELELFMISSGPEVHYVYPNGDEVSNIEIVYICRKYTGEPVPQEGEVEELRWIKPEDITDDMISPPIKPVFKEYFMRFGINRSKTEQRALDMPFSKIYQLLSAKVEKKGRTKAELDMRVAELTGYDIKGFYTEGTYGDFLKNAPAFRNGAIHGSVCGINVDNIKDPLIYRMRCIDKLTDDVAKGK